MITVIPARWKRPAGTSSLIGLGLTEDEAKDLIVWLMTDHEIVAVERDTPEGDVFRKQDD